MPLPDKRSRRVRWAGAAAVVFLLVGAAPASAFAAPVKGPLGASLGVGEFQATMSIPEPCDPGIPESCEPASCLVDANQSVTRGNSPTLGTYSRVAFSATISCYGSGYVWVIGSADLVDRSQGYNGRTLAYGDDIHDPVEYRYPATSRGVAYLYDRDFPAGTDAEVVFSLTAEQQYGVWGGCFGDGFIRCDGEGTPVLDVIVGFGSFTTGVSPACATESPEGGPDEFVFVLDCTVAAAASANGAIAPRTAALPPKITCRYGVDPPYNVGFEVKVKGWVNCTHPVSTLVMNLTITVPTEGLTGTTGIVSRVATDRVDGTASVSCSHGNFLYRVLTVSATPPPTPWYYFYRPPVQNRILNATPVQVVCP
jgi:hypothetical protein